MVNTTTANALASASHQEFLDVICKILFLFEANDKQCLYFSNFGRVRSLWHTSVLPNIRYETPELYN